MAALAQRARLAPVPTPRARRAGVAAAAPRGRAAMRATGTNGRSIVLAVDQDQQGALAALHYTLQHLYRDGDVLHVLAVVPAASSLRASQGQCLASTLPPEEGLQEQMAAHARSYFEARFLPLTEQFGARAELDLVSGRCNATVSDTICRKVEDLAAELVVLNVQRSQHWLQDFFQAPISRQVAESCTRPTLILHSDCCQG